MWERIRWLRRRPQSAPVKRVEALVVDGMRRRGRPKLRWEDRVKLDMKKLLLSEDMTSDRNKLCLRVVCLSCVFSSLFVGFCVLDSDSRFMNQYFLLIACLQLWPLITPVNPASTWGPLIFIFAVSATKEGWDDYCRYLSDKKANEKEVWVVRQGSKKLIQAQEIYVGNLVWHRENDEVPCDLILLGTSEPQGVCYVETTALDGETDLKTRSAPPACMGLERVSLNDTGVGNETKLGMSRGVAEPKLTAMDALIDKLTRVIFTF
ncbi:phospholipid-transporting ATPase 2 [Tanacetum coccineum]